MKKLTSLIALMLFCFGCKGQTKETAKYDTVPIPHIVLIKLDSAQYRFIMEFVSSFPIGNEKVQVVYQLLNGSQKNIQLIPQYGLKPKNKKK